MGDVTERFLKYVAIDTQSSEDSNTFPSTDKQKKLARILRDELMEMGAKDVYMDEEKCYIYAHIPASEGREDDKVLGFIAHMDTSPETSGENVTPNFIYKYDGTDIDLGKNGKYIMRSDAYPELLSYVGKTIITSDGTTLLGADDKAGVAEIMSMAKILLKDDNVSHGPVSIAFTPDEEIGKGVDYFSQDKFGADFAYTVDGGALGELEYENFNAASLEVIVHGVTVHPGEAKNKMKNASRIAMEYDKMLPEREKPEYTEEYEGFFHLCDMSGCTEEANLSYIVRDHDRAKFENKKKIAKNAADYLNDKYGEGTVEVIIKDSYYNMKEIIYPDNMFLIENAKNAMLKENVEPVIRPIRGGTDGARLSFMGLPCPNICTGGHNFHGRYEYVCVESMESIVKILVNIVTDFSIK